MRILRLNKSGLPQAWLSRQEAATIYARQQVLWSLGDEALKIYGGKNASGEQSFLDLAPIIATGGDTSKRNFVPALTNRLLFRRDGHLCMYCGYDFDDRQLTCDHIIPRVQGGRDKWTNVVAACARCNHRKGGQTPEQAGMELLAIPSHSLRPLWVTDARVPSQREHENPPGHHDFTTASSHCSTVP